MFSVLSNINARSSIQAFRTSVLPRLCFPSDSGARATSRRDPRSQLDPPSRATLGWGQTATGLEFGFPISFPEANYVTSLSFKPHVTPALQGSTEVMHGKHLSKRLALKMHALLHVCHSHRSTEGP